MAFIGREQPRGGQLGVTIGIHKYRDIKQTKWIIGMPFKGRVSEYAINARNWTIQEKTEKNTESMVKKSKV